MSCARATRVTARIALGRLLSCLVCIAAPPGAAAQAEPSLPGFAELEAAGAVIGEIRISALDIFDTSDPKEDNALFRAANRLHVQTRPEVIRHALLFRTGEPLSVRAIEETERRLRANRYLYDVRFRVLAVHDKVVDIEVITRDTWSLDPGLSASRAGGSTTSSIQIREYNLLGTGSSVALGRSKGVDRSGTQFDLASDRIFGSQVGVAYSHAANSDGGSDSASVVQPFHELDARWAAGARMLRNDRLEPVYSGGVLASQYRHREQQAEVFGGWSNGLVDGWVHRTSLGVGLQQDRYAIEPGLAPPSTLPPDQKLVAPFVRYELIEDRFEREVNRNLIGRPEFFALGLAASVQLGWALPAFGSSRRAAIYAGSISRGFEPGDGQRLIVAARADGQYEEDKIRRGRFGLLAQYYLPQSPRRLFYAAVAIDTLQRPDPGTTLLLGGDSGLRGYPLRYQNGNRRVVLTVEQRFYTDLFVWRLFRIGGAAFADVGRAWGGADPNALNPGWLGNGGIGLRIVSARSAFSNVLHIDLAMPFNATPDIKKVQLLVKTKTSF
jgi:hypothetical protein